MEVTNRLVHAGHDGKDGQPVVVPLVDPAIMYVCRLVLDVDVVLTRLFLFSIYSLDSRRRFPIDLRQTHT
jgi:hypothetical protein